MPRETLEALRSRVPKARPYLMYGLTEAFRSTYLPPEQVDLRPDSIGKAIPNAEILVLREDGSECAPDEPGELVHRGALVGQGYWNDADKTAERYKLLPGRPGGLMLPEYAVFSGDTVRRDAEGFLYFIGRRDEMIKTSGYRVSPTEVEEIALRHPDGGRVRGLRRRPQDAGPGDPGHRHAAGECRRAGLRCAAGRLPAAHAGVHGACRHRGGGRGRCRAIPTARSTASCWPRRGSKETARLDAPVSVACRGRRRCARCGERLVAQGRCSALTPGSEPVDLRPARPAVNPWPAARANAAAPQARARRACPGH